MFCPYCGTALPEGGKFCMGCGKPMPMAPASARPNPGSAAGAPAPNTGGPASSGSRLTSDGAPRAARAQNAPTARSPDPAPPSQWPERTAMPPSPRRPPLPASDSRSRVGPLIAAALLALLLVGGGGFWLLRRSQDAPGSVAAVPAPESGETRSIDAPPSPGFHSCCRHKASGRRDYPTGASNSGSGIGAD